MAIREVSQVIESLKHTLAQMEEVLELTELAERQKLADEREIDSLRRALRPLNDRMGDRPREREARPQNSRGPRDRREAQSPRPERGPRDFREPRPEPEPPAPAEFSSHDEEPQQGS